MATKKRPTRQFLLCVKNDDYPVSLEVRKIYQVIPDESAAARLRDVGASQYA